MQRVFDGLQQAGGGVPGVGGELLVGVLDGVQILAGVVGVTGQVAAGILVLLDLGEGLLVLELIGAAAGVLDADQVAALVAVIVAVRRGIAAAVGVDLHLTRMVGEPGLRRVLGRALQLGEPAQAGQGMGGGVAEGVGGGADGILDLVGGGLGGAGLAEALDVTGAERQGGAGAAVHAGEHAAGLVVGVGDVLRTPAVVDDAVIGGSGRPVAE